MVAPQSLKAYLRQTPPSNLWHYTSLEALQGIVDSCSIWATDVRFLNDSREFIYARDIFTEVIDDRKERAPSADELVFISAKEMLQYAWHEDKYQVFVASFSANEDQLSQWRAYGASVKSVSLSLDLSDAVLQRPYELDILAPCVYDADLQRQFAGEWVDEYVKIVKEGLSSQGKPLPLENGERGGGLVNGIVDAVGKSYEPRLFENIYIGGKLAALFKHPKFIEEAEWRIVLAQSRNEDRPQSLPPIRARVGQSTMIPYTHISLNKDDSSEIASRVLSVTLGPHPDPERAKSAMTEYLLLSGQGHIRVACSSIPFRTW